MFRAAAILAVLIASGQVLAKDPTADASLKDLYRHARPEPSVKATGCEWAGTGYVRLDGSDTCVRLGGFVRGEAAIIGTPPAFRPSVR